MRLNIGGGHTLDGSKNCLGKVVVSFVFTLVGVKSQSVTECSGDFLLTVGECLLTPHCHYCRKSSYTCQ